MICVGDSVDFGVAVLVKPWQKICRYNAPEQTHVIRSRHWWHYHLLNGNHDVAKSSREIWSRSIRHFITKSRATNFRDLSRRHLTHALYAWAYKHKQLFKPTHKLLTACNGNACVVYFGVANCPSLGMTTISCTGIPTTTQTWYLSWWCDSTLWNTRPNRNLAYNGIRNVTADPFTSLSLLSTLYGTHDTSPNAILTYPQRSLI